MAQNVKIFCTASIGAVLVFTLTGCDNNLFQGPVSLRMDGTDLRIAVCKTAEVDTLFIEERNTGIFRSWSDRLLGTGQASVVSGTSFTGADPLPGMTIREVGELELNPGHELAVTLTGRTSDDYIDAVFVVGASGVPTSGWLQSDGTVSELPCP